MTVDEYKAEVRQHDIATVVRMVASLAIIFAALAVAGVIRYYDDALADVLAPIVIFTIGTPLMIYGFTRVDRTYRRFPALICPHCDGTIARPKSTVIATGNCPNCGRNVLADATIGT
ncbi:MAG: hypothetical protein F9B45_08900 [Phycisphaera sp. RhM]|nr:hypothetical protein [Phycisphaera sp. RhM]